MASKKAVPAKKSILHKKVVLHKRLEQPVHNLVGYTILLILAIITFVIIMSIQQSV